MIKLTPGVLQNDESLIVQATETIAQFNLMLLEELDLADEAGLQ